jgi:hypothetical protein
MREVKRRRQKAGIKGTLPHSTLGLAAENGTRYMTNMANPTGIGGVRFQPGVSGNPSGRSRAQQMGMSSVQLHALKFCIEAVELIAGIMRSSHSGIIGSTFRLWEAPKCRVDHKAVW